LRPGPGLPCAQSRGGTALAALLSEVETMAQRIGSALFQIGGMMLLIGLALVRFPNAFSWFGHLPGDIMTEHVIAPFASMLVVSLAISGLSRLFSALLRLIR